MRACLCQSRGHYGGDVEGAIILEWELKRGADVMIRKTFLMWKVYMTVHLLL